MWRHAHNTNTANSKKACALLPCLDTATAAMEPSMKAQLEELKDADMSVRRKFQQTMAILAKDGRIYKQKLMWKSVLIWRWAYS